MLRIASLMQFQRIMRNRQRGVNEVGGNQHKVAHQDVDVVGSENRCGVLDGNRGVNATSENVVASKNDLNVS